MFFKNVIKTLAQTHLFTHHSWNIFWNGGFF